MCRSLRMYVHTHYDGRTMCNEQTEDISTHLSLSHVLGGQRTSRRNHENPTGKTWWKSG